MNKNKLLALALVLGLGTSNVSAQTNLIAGWDGGDDASSPSNFGWTSSANRTLQPRNNNGGIRMTNTYSDYKLEDGTAYSYSADSEPSSMIFWIRYNSSGESFTYTFQGLEADSYYDFSALVGWHNNSNAPTVTVMLNDGTNTLATMTKVVNAKTTLYPISTIFKTPSTMTNTTDVKIVFTCNQTGDCMVALSALSLVETFVDELPFAKEDALAALPTSAGDGFFTMTQDDIDAFAARINAATTVDAVEAIKAEIVGWNAPALIGNWNIKNVTAASYLGTDGENVVLSETPVSITFEKADKGFYIKAGDNYINMKGNNSWSMSVSTTASTVWTFTLNDGKYTISGPNGLIGTDDTAAGSFCFGNKAVGNNGTWTISEAISEDQIAITIAKNALQAALNAITVPTVNIGDGVFQYKQTDVDALAQKVKTAQNVLDSETSTTAELDAQTEIISNLSPLILNAPDADKKYKLIVSTPGHSKEGNAIIIIPGSTTANNPTGYALNGNFEPNVNLNQSVTFTKVSGNLYNISYETTEGTTYLTYGEINGSAAGWAKWQIQATTDDSKKGEFKIAASSTDNAFIIYNSITNSTIACQPGGNIYTEEGNADFSLVEATQPSIAINTTAAGWGTVMLPFAVASLPEGVKAYTCAGVTAEDETVLELAEVTALEANKPYIIEGAWEATLTRDAQGTALTVTEGLLTGVYETQDAPEGKYILQNQNDVVGFYQVDYAYLEEKELNKPLVKANRAYLTAPAGDGTVKAFFLGENTTAVNAVKVAADKATVYNLAGQRVNKAQKGIYIVNGQKVVK